MSRRLRFAALLPLTLLLSSAPLASADGRETAAARTTVLDLDRQYQADQSSLREAFELPASEAYLDRQQQLGEDWRARLEKFDFASLDPREKAEYLLLRSEVQGLLDETARAKKRLAEIAPLLPFRTMIHDLETARRHWGVLDGQAAASKVADLTAAVKQVREHLPKPGGKPVSAAVALRTAGTVHELQELLKRWYSFYDGYQPDFAWWVKKPYEDAAKQLDEYAKYLREEVAQLKGKDEDPLVGEPIGAEALAAGIRREWLPYTADELIAIGEREFAFCEQEMKKAAREMKLGDDWKAALARVKADYVPPGQQDELVARIAREATDFVKRRDLVTVPRLCEESWGLTMISPETLKTIPYAAYNGRQMMVAYANGEMKQDDKLMVMRGNNRHFTRLVIPHELIPGHHLQDYYASRGPERPFSTLLLRGRLGLVLGIAAVGPGLGANARGPHRHALLADDPLGPRDPHAEVSPRPHDAGGDGRVPHRPRGAREARRPRRGAAFHPGRAAVPGRLSDRRAADSRPARRDGGPRQAQRTAVPRRRAQAGLHAHRVAARRPDWAFRCRKTPSPRGGSRSRRVGQASVASAGPP